MGKILNINLSKIDLFLGRQGKIKSKNYSLSDMTAKMKRGDYGKRTLSGVLLEERKDKNASLMAISSVLHQNTSYFTEGTPSNTVLKNLTEWFKTVSDACFENADAMEQSLVLFLERENERLTESKIYPISSLACSIKTENFTVFAVIGDCHAYIIRDGKVEEALKNDSLLSRYNGILYQNEKFNQEYSENNLGVKFFDRPNTLVTPNNYESIILTTKEVGKNITVDEMNKMLRENPDKMTASRLVDTTASRSFNDHNFTPYEDVCDDMIAAVQKRKIKK